MRPTPGQPILQVAAVVADHCGLRLADVLGDGRDRHLVEARWMAAEIACRLTGASTYAVARALRRDPRTVCHGRRQLRSLMASRIDLAGIIDQLERRCARALACPALEPCLRAESILARDQLVLNELARRLRQDWTVTIQLLDGFLGLSPRETALLTNHAWTQKGDRHVA